MATFSHRTFAGGEIAPSLHARVDSAKYQTGLATCRNMVVMKHGGITRRPGTQFIGRHRYHGADANSAKTRLVPWVYDSDGTSYILEFGHLYFSVIRNGAYIQKGTYHISSVVTSTGSTNHGGRFTVSTDASFQFAVGDIVKFSKVAGTATNMEGQEFKVARVVSGSRYIWLVDFHLQNNTNDKRSSSITSITQSGSTSTLLLDSGETIFDADDVGRYISIWNTDTAANNGTFQIASLVNSRSVTYTNASGATDNSPNGNCAIVVLPNGTMTNTGNDDEDMVLSKRLIVKGIPYNGVDLYKMRYVQNGTTLTTTLEGAPILEITRQDDTKWAVEQFIPGTGRKVAKPTNVATDAVYEIADADDVADDEPYVRYAISVVNGDGQESLPTYTSHLFAHHPTADAVTELTGLNLNNNNTEGGNLRVNGTSSAITFDFGAARKVGLKGMSSARKIVFGDRFTFHGTDYFNEEISETLSGATINPDADKSQYQADLMTTNYFKTISHITSARDIPTGTGSGQSRLRIVLGPADMENITITWTNPNDTDDGPYSYRVYRSNGSRYGLIGETRNLRFHDVGIEPDYSTVPLSSRNPFASALELQKADFRKCPAVCGAFQQRRLFARQGTHPERIHLSGIGRLDVFDYRNILKDDDPFYFELASQRANRVTHIVSLQRLLLFTDNGEWVINSDTITPTQINAVQYSHYGTNHVAPVVIGNNCVFLQPRGMIIRDFGWKQEANGYTGNDLTVFAGHLFRRKVINDMTYAQGPDSIVWCTRTDGVLLGMTYMPEHNIVAWHRHDMDSYDIKGVESVAEGTGQSSRDTLYMVAQETESNNGVMERYLLRTEPTEQDHWEQYANMDAFVTQNGWNSDEDLTLTISTGTTYVAGQTLTVTAASEYFFDGLLEPGGTWVGKKLVFGTIGETPTLTITIAGKTSNTVVTGTATINVPAALQATATDEWGLARNEVSNKLWHLVGKDVSVYADGVVLHSPYNDAYDTKTVSATGSISLADYYVRISVGLPMVCDLETLNIDQADGETLADKKQLVTAVTLQFNESRGGFIGPRIPATDGALTDMYEISGEEYPGEDDGDVGGNTGNFTQIISPDWDSNGRVGIRLVDPYQMEIIGIHPNTTPTIRRSR